MGWQEGAMDEFLETKQQIREKRIRTIVQMQMCQKRKSRSLSPEGSSCAFPKHKLRARTLSPSLLPASPRPLVRSDASQHLSRSRKRMQYYRSRAMCRRFLSPSEPDFEIMIAHLQAKRSRDDSYSSYQRKGNWRNRSPSPPAVVQQRTRRSSPPISSYQRFQRSNLQKDQSQKRKVSRWSSKPSSKKARLLNEASRWDDVDDDVKITSARLRPQPPTW